MPDQTRIDSLRNVPVPPQNLFIDGAWQPGTGETLDVLSPIDGTVLTTLSRATPQDVTRAVASARAAFEDGRWSNRPPAARKKVLLNWPS